jgi:hypothetical protein
MAVEIEGKEPQIVIPGVSFKPHPIYMNVLAKE